LETSGDSEGAITMLRTLRKSVLGPLKIKLPLRSRGCHLLRWGRRWPAGVSRQDARRGCSSWLS